MPGWPLRLHKPDCPCFLTPLAMASFLHAKSRIHATFLSSSTLSNPVTTFIVSINSSLRFMPYISSESASRPPPLYCHILYTFCPPSSNLFISQTCSYAVAPLSFVSIVVIFFLLTPIHLDSNPPLTSSLIHTVLATPPTPPPTMWSLTSMHISLACTSPLHLTCLSRCLNSHHSIQSLQDIAPVSPSTSLSPSVTVLLLLPFHEPFFSHIHNIVPKFNTTLFSFPLQREQPHLNL